MKVVRLLLWSVLLSSLAISFFTLRRLFETAENPAAPLPLGLTPQSALEELRPGGRAAQGLQALLGDDSAILENLPAQAKSAPAAAPKAAPEPSGRQVLFDAGSGGGVDVTANAKRGAKAAKGGGVLIDSSGRRFELASQSKPQPKEALLKRLAPLSMPVSPVWPAARPTRANGIFLLGLGAAAAAVAVLVALKRFKP